MDKSEKFNTYIKMEMDKEKEKDISKPKLKVKPVNNNTIIIPKIIKA